MGFDRNGFAAMFAGCGEPNSLRQTGGMFAVGAAHRAAHRVVFAGGGDTPDRELTFVHFATFGGYRAWCTSNRDPAGRTLICSKPVNIVVL